MLPLRLMSCQLARLPQAPLTAATHSLKNVTQTAVKLTSVQYNSKRSMMNQSTGAYEGDGKTVATNLSEQLSKYVIIDKYSPDGFRLSNGSFAFGPIILFPHVVFQWKVKTLEDINSDSLTLFKLLEPKLDLLIVGIGDPRMVGTKRVHELKAEMKGFGINAEILSTRDAIATYNFLLADFRIVGGAFLPTLSDSETKLLNVRPQSTYYLPT